MTAGLALGAAAAGLVVGGFAAGGLAPGAAGFVVFGAVALGAVAAGGLVGRGAAGLVAGGLVVGIGGNWGIWAMTLLPVTSTKASVARDSIQRDDRHQLPNLSFAVVRFAGVSGSSRRQVEFMAASVRKENR